MLLLAGYPGGAGRAFGDLDAQVVRLAPTSISCSCTQRPWLQTFKVARPSGASGSLNAPLSSTVAKNGEFTTSTEMTRWGNSASRMA